VKLLITTKEDNIVKQGSGKIEKSDF